MLELANRNYSRRFNTYNACWLENGEPAMWGNYCLDDGSYYLATRRAIVASGNWYSSTGSEEDAVFETMGVYSFQDVRRAIQTGVLECREKPLNLLRPANGDLWEMFE